MALIPLLERFRYTHTLLWTWTGPTETVGLTINDKMINHCHNDKSLPLVPAQYSLKDTSLPENINMSIPTVQRNTKVNLGHTIIMKHADLHIHNITGWPLISNL